MSAGQAHDYLWLTAVSRLLSHWLARVSCTEVGLCFSGCLSSDMGTLWARPNSWASPAPFGLAYAGNKGNKRGCNTPRPIGYSLRDGYWLLHLLLLLLWCWLLHGGTKGVGGALVRLARFCSGIKQQADAWSLGACHPAPVWYQRVQPRTLLWCAAALGLELRVEEWLLGPNSKRRAWEKAFCARV